MDDVPQQLSRFGRGEITFADLVDQFEKATFVLPERPKDIGEMYLRAEEGDDRDVPKALYAARFAREISQAQQDQLMKIYRQRLIR